MFQLDLKNRESIYEQIINNFKELMISGVLKENDKLPSVRELSKTLTVNPNTVQKSYRELEHQGYVYTVTGLGCFVAPPQTILRDERKIHKIKETLSRELRELLYLGLSLEEIQKILEEILQKGSEEK